MLIILHSTCPTGINWENHFRIDAHATCVFRCIAQRILVRDSWYINYSILHIFDVFGDCVSMRKCTGLLSVHHHQFNSISLNAAG